ncbi:tubby-related protein 2 isoform X2 [Cavia porcellus]|uniref:tubby-related protein 2 isoform X2 n=1 Tax=Cavia porcellus TaxID=10141 RepID=UPI002FE41B09
MGSHGGSDLCFSHRTLMEELISLRMQKLDQQWQLFEKKQRRKRREPLMVQSNPDVSLRYRRMQSEHFASHKGPALRECMSEEYPDSGFHSALCAPVNCGGDGTSELGALGRPAQADNLETRDPSSPQFGLMRMPRAQSPYHQSEPQDVEAEYHQSRWGSAYGMDGDRKSHGDLIFCKDTDSEEEEEESHYLEINSQAAEGQETVPRDLEGGDSHDVGTMNSLPPLDLGPQPGENLREYMLRPTLKGHVVQCCIHRNQQGLEKGLFPVYYLYLEAAEGWKRFLLAGRKRKWSKTANYLISLDPMDLSRDGDNFVGKVRSNILGTKFVIFDNGVNPEDSNSLLDRSHIRQELGTVCYETNIWGTRGPRKMTVIIPEINDEHQRIRVQPETLAGAG